MIDYKTITVTPFAQNCRIFVNYDTSECVVVDPGDRAEDIYNAIVEAKLTLKAILITHMHLDHVGAVAKLSKLSGAKIMGSSIEDEPIKTSLPMQAVNFGLNECEKFETEYLKDGDIIEPMSDFSLKVLHTPGHTPGGVCYYCKKLKLVLTGDTLFNGSVGRTDFLMGDYDSLINGIKTKLFALDDETEVLSGHGPNSTILDEKTTNPYVV